MNRESGIAFIFVSELLGRPVRDAGGRPVGRIQDLVATTGEMYPIVRGLLVRLQDRSEKIAALGAENVSRVARRERILVDPAALARVDLGPSDFLVRDLLLDKQIVDVQGAKVERVNDVHLLLTDKARVVHVDVGFTGLLRRMGIERLARGAFRAIGRDLPDELISWKFVQPLAESEEEPQPGRPIRLKVEHAKIRDLHPGELADILEDLGKDERTMILHSLGPEAAADALEEAGEDVQAAAISQLDPSVAADILEEMDPSEAADILTSLPEEQTEEIIAEVEAPEREQIEKLIEYEDRTAAALMTPEFVSVRRETTVAEAMEEVRRMAPEIEGIYYVYVLDADRRLEGVTTLRSLFRAPPGEKVGGIMETRLVTLAPEEGLQEVAEVFQKYSFLGVPVVDSESRMLGVILIKHAFDELLPEFRREARA